MNGYIYIVVPKDIRNHIHFELSKIGYFTTDNIEKTIHNNYSRSMGSYIIYESIKCKSENTRHYEKVIHLMLEKYRNKPPHEVFNLSSNKAKEIVKQFKEYVINTDILEENEDNVSENTKIQTEKEKFIEHYKLTDNIIKLFEKIEHKMTIDELSEEDFQKEIKNKLIYNKNIYETFQKYLLLRKYKIEDLEQIFIIKNVLDKYFQHSDSSDDYVTKKEIKKILKQNKIKINDIDLIRTIEALYDCQYILNTTIDSNIIQRIFKKIKQKNNIK